MKAVLFLAVCVDGFFPLFAGITDFREDVVIFGTTLPPDYDLLRGRREVFLWR